MEMYDMKPDAPADYRGEFRPIRSNVPGIDVSEHLPLHAKCADKYTIIRSVHHTFSDHGGGHKRFLTGRDPMSPVGFVNDSPMVGSFVSKVREGRNVQKSRGSRFPRDDLGWDLAGHDAAEDAGRLPSAPRLSTHREPS